MNDEPKLANITGIEYFPKMGEDKGKIGYVNFVINGLVKVLNVGVYTKMGKGSYRLRYPFGQLWNGEQNSYIHPISSQVGIYIERFVSDYIDKLIT